MKKSGRGELARGTGGPEKPHPDADRPTVRMPHSQVRELLSSLLPSVPDEIDADPTAADGDEESRPTMQRSRKRTVQPPRKPQQLRRSSPDELIALLRKSGLKEPRR